MKRQRDRYIGDRSEGTHKYSYGLGICSHYLERYDHKKRVVTVYFRFHSHERMTVKYVAYGIDICGSVVDVIHHVEGPGRISILVATVEIPDSCKVKYYTCQDDAFKDEETSLLIKAIDQYCSHYKCGAAYKDLRRTSFTRKKIGLAAHVSKERQSDNAKKCRYPLLALGRQDLGESDIDTGRSYKPQKDRYNVCLYIAESLYSERRCGFTKRILYK